jgi:amino acid adenylation domain-containing protein
MSHIPQYTVVDLFAQQADKTPDSVALCWEGGQLTYAELDARSSQLAQFLVQHHGVGKTSTVALCVERSMEMIVGILGVLKAGAAYLPVDPVCAPERFAYMLGDCGPRVFLTQQKLEASLPARRMPTVRLDGDWQAVAQESTNRPALPAAPESLAYVIYTSGSTGTPKGVLIPHAALTNQMLWLREAFPLAGDDVVLQKTPFIFDASVWEILAPLLSGAKLVMARPNWDRNPEYLIEAVIRQGVTQLQLVPSMLRVFLEFAGVEKCTGLRNVFSGGEVLTTELRDTVFERLRGVRLHNLYGPTETCIQCIAYSCDENERRPGTTVPIGRPIANTRAYVLDERLQPVAAGAEGELYIGGEGLACGYLGLDDLTRQYFVADPFGPPGLRLYRTGDRVRYLPDGNLEFVGRTDQQIKLHGHRIELGEIEAALMTHPAVREAVVTTTDDSMENKRLIAHIMYASGQQPGAAELRDHLQRRLAASMIPSIFTTVTHLPLLPSGKIDRRSLSGITPELAGTRSSTPLSQTQAVLAEVWEEILKVTNVGVEDDFFDLGGYSLMFILMVAKANERLGTSLGIELVSQGTTIAAITPMFANAMPSLDVQPRSAAR